MLPRSSSQPKERSNNHIINNGNGANGNVLAHYPSLPPSSAQPRSRRSVAVHGHTHTPIANGHGHGNGIIDMNDASFPQHQQRNTAMIPPPQPQRIPARSAPSANRASSNPLARPHTGHGMTSVARAGPTIAFGPSGAPVQTNPRARVPATNVHQLLAPSPVPIAVNVNHSNGNGNVSRIGGTAVPYTPSNVHINGTSRYTNPSTPSLATILTGVTGNVATPRASHANGIPAVNQAVPSSSSSMATTSRSGVATAPSVAGRNGSVANRIGSGRRRDPSLVAALDVTPKIGSLPSSSLSSSSSPWMTTSIPSAVAHRAALVEEKHSQLSYQQSPSSSSHSHHNNHNPYNGNMHDMNGNEAKEYPVSSPIVATPTTAATTSVMRAVSAARRTRVPVVTPATVGGNGGNVAPTVNGHHSAAPVPSLQSAIPNTHNHTGGSGNGYYQPMNGYGNNGMYDTQRLSATPTAGIQRPSSGAAMNGLSMNGSRPPSSANNFARTMPFMTNGSIGIGMAATATPTRAPADDLKLALTIPSATGSGNSNSIGNGNAHHTNNNSNNSSNSLHALSGLNMDGHESSRDTGRSSSRTSSRSSSPGGIIDVAVSEDPNPRYRPTMEDAHVIQFDMGNDKKHSKSTSGKSKPKHGYFAIYDGHGGRAAVDYISANLHKNVEKELAAISENGPTTPSHAHVSREAEAFHRAFLTTDQAMAHESRYQETGATVAAALIRPSKSRKGGRDLFVANAGDSRVVLATSTVAGGTPTALQLTHDHRPVTPGEIDRVRKAGGAVIAGRVNGQLAVSRALGDHALKRHGVSAVPHQTAVALDKQHKFVIVGCDGLWDVVTDQEAVQAVAGMKSAKKMADKLVRMAMSRGTTDNVSVMAIRLRDD